SVALPWFRTVYDASLESPALTSSGLSVRSPPSPAPVELELSMTNPAVHCASVPPAVDGELRLVAARRVAGGGEDVVLLRAAVRRQRRQLAGLVEHRGAAAVPDLER